MNYNSVQSLHFSQPTGVFLSMLIWDFPNPRYIFESILKEEVPQNLCSFRCSFRLTIVSTGHVLSDQILHRSSSEAKWTPSFMGTGKKQRDKYMLLHCICNILQHLATSPRILLPLPWFFCPLPARIFWWLLGDGGWTVYHIHFLFFASLREIRYIYIYILYIIYIIYIYIIYIIYIYIYIYYIYIHYIYNIHIHNIIYIYT